MKEYRFKNGIIYVIGEVNVNKLKTTTIHFAKEVYKFKKFEGEKKWQR